MKNNTLLDKAFQNYEVAHIIYTQKSDDESFLNYAAYHLQQAIELSLKYTLEMNGIEYPKTHDIDQLIRIGDLNQVDMHISGYIEDHSEMFSLWEARTRYVLNYQVEKKKIDKAINEVGAYINKLSLSFQNIYDNEMTM